MVKCVLTLLSLSDRCWVVLRNSGLDDLTRLNLAGLVFHKRTNANAFHLRFQVNLEILKACICMGLQLKSM